MDTPSQIITPFAESATSEYKRTIPESGSATDTNASKQLGFPPLTMQIVGGTPPDGRDMNGVLNEIYRMLRYLQAGGVYPYSSTFCTAIGGYPLGARVLCATDNKSLWVNTVAGNTTDPDSTSAQGWLLHQVEMSSLYSSAYIGSIVMWPKAESTIPTNALVCKGQTLSSTNYPELYTAWFGTYQAGQSFSLPNFSNGYYPRGYGSGTQSVGSRGSCGLPNIKGSFTASDYAFKYTAPFYKISSGNGRPDKSGDGATVGFDASKSNAIFGRTTSTVETNNVAVNFIVFVR